MFKIGCAEKVLEVPLFVELFGYGYFDGRRNRGTTEPLYCRVASLNDGSKRALIVYTDTCVACHNTFPAMRKEIAARFGIDYNYITMLATHTHSAPVLGDGGYGFGYPDHDFIESWKKLVFELVGAAIADEEEIAEAFAGKVPLSERISRNRVDKVNGITDPDIRWVKFTRADGSCKLLIHNHGAHPICANGVERKSVSADWPGAVNRIIQAEKIAEFPILLLGPCGDTNSFPTDLDTGSANSAEEIARKYVPDLQKSLVSGGTKLTDLKLRAQLRNVRMPDVPHSAARMREDAEKLRKINEWNGELANRLEEMAMCVEAGKDLGRNLDFQVLRIGEASFFFIPGELFLEGGMELMKQAAGKFPLLATVANDGGGYFPSEEVMKMYPTVESHHGSLFGFYEVFSYPAAFAYRYADNVLPFITETLLDIEKSL